MAPHVDVNFNALFHVTVPCFGNGRPRIGAHCSYGSIAGRSAFVGGAGYGARNTP